MNYLFTYLHALGEEERTQLDDLLLSPRERETLAALFAMEPKSGATKEEARVRLGMSGTMFDKTCSLLLRRVYNTIAPEGGMQLVRDLHGRGLHAHLLHEVRVQERQIAQGGREEQLRFYHDLFVLLHQNFTIHYDPVLAARIARKLHRLAPDADIRLFTEASMLAMAVWRAAAGEADPEVDAGLLQRLQRLQRRVDGGAGPRTRYRLLRNWIVYYGQIDCQAEVRADLLDQTIDLCRTYPEVLGSAELLGARMMRAEHEYFFGDSHRTAYEHYRAIFDEHSDALSQQRYHRSKYIQLATILGEYHEAESLLERFAASPNDPDVGHTKGSALAWAKLYLMTDRFPEARNAIDLAFELNQKRFFVQFEIECRLLQTAWCVLSGDVETAEQLVPTHLKYLRSKGYTPANSLHYPWFFKLVLALIEERHTGKRLSRQLQQRYDGFQQGAAAQYGLLLERMRRR